MKVQDMTDLICVRDAYKLLNKSLFGEEMVLGFHEGYMGALGRVFRVIERNVAQRWKKDDDNAMRILDATVLSAEERARLLLDEDRCRLQGEEVLVEKYKFEKELKEAVLAGRIINGEATIIVDGEEKTARCQACGKISSKGEGLPCLVSESNNNGSLSYTVEAVLHDNKGGEKNGICIRPILLEQAVGYFLENHQMEEMVGDYNYVRRLPTTGMCKPDYIAGKAWIEVRLLRRNTNISCSYSQWSHIERYCKQMADMKGKDERIILLLVRQVGTEEELWIPSKGQTNEAVKRVVGYGVENGVEIWTASLQFDIDGICLQSYQNMTSEILGG